MTLATRTPLLEVLLSPEAGQDLQDIYTYIAASAGHEQADTILGTLEQVILSLESLPLRGNIPPELETVVHVHWIFDARRDVAGQLAQKILRH